MLDPEPFILAEKCTQRALPPSASWRHRVLPHPPCALPTTRRLGLCKAQPWASPQASPEESAYARQRNQATYRVVLFMNAMALLQLADDRRLDDYHQPLVYRRSSKAWPK